MLKISFEIERCEVAEVVFKTLEREVVFPRGRIKVLADGDRLKIVAFASDISSARSLSNTILRALYIIRGVEELP